MSETLLSHCKQFHFVHSVLVGHVRRVVFFGGRIVSVKIFGGKNGSAPPLRKMAPTLWGWVTCMKAKAYTGCFVKTALFIFGYYNSYNNGPICIKFAGNVQDARREILL